MKCDRCSNESEELKEINMIGVWLEVCNDCFEHYKGEERICKLCKEKRILLLGDMCDLCYDYLTKRVNRIIQENLREVFKK